MHNIKSESLKILFVTIWFSKGPYSDSSLSHRTRWLQDQVSTPYRCINAYRYMQWNIHRFWDGMMVRFPGNVSPVGVLIASINKSLRCLFVPCVTSINHTSGCIVTRRIISSVGIDIISIIQLHHSISAISAISQLLPRWAQDYSTKPVVHWSDGPCCDTIVILLQFDVLSRNSYIPSYSDICKKYKLMSEKMSARVGQLYNKGRLEAPYEFTPALWCEFTLAWR